jgi:hypothetical protein
VKYDLHATLKPISEFAAKPYTEDEKRSLAEIIHTFNERHGTQFTEADFLRFEQVNREIPNEDMTEMLRNNPPDVVFSAFSQAFFEGAIRMFQRDNEMKKLFLAIAKCALRRSAISSLVRCVRRGKHRRAKRQPSKTSHGVTIPSGISVGFAV